MGNVYFNIVQVPCVEHSDDPNKREAKPKSQLTLQFSQQQLAYR
jgi:hypothetical protein